MPVCDSDSELLVGPRAKFKDRCAAAVSRPRVTTTSPDPNVTNVTERYADGALEIEVAGDAANAASALERFGKTTATGSRLRVHTEASPGEVVPALEAAGVVVLSLEWHRPNLETVFLSLTGRRLRDEP